MNPSPSNHDPIELRDSAKWFPGSPHISAIWRWGRKGVVARNGLRVRLYHFRVGRKLFTTQAAIVGYLETLRKADMDHFQQASRPTPVERQVTAKCNQTKAIDFLKSRGIAV